MFALFLSGSKQNAVLLEMEEGKEEKGMLKARVGWGCSRNESFALAVFPRSQQDAFRLWDVSVTCHTCWLAWSCMPDHVPKDSKGSLRVCAQPGGIGGLCGQELPPQTPSQQPVSAKSPQERGIDVPGGTHSAWHLPEVQWLILWGAVRMHTYTHTELYVLHAFCTVIQPLILAVLILLDMWLQATEK